MASSKPVLLDHRLKTSCCCISPVRQAQAGLHVTQALSPHYWFRFFLRNRGEAWRVLSGVLLSATGTE